MLSPGEPNGKIDYGILVQKVNQLLESNQEINQKLDIFMPWKEKIEQRYNEGGCKYSIKIEERVRCIEDWKTGLLGKISVITGIIIFLGSTFSPYILEFFKTIFK